MIERSGEDVAGIWARIAVATPRRARRRSLLLAGIVLAFSALTIPGGIVLWGVAQWMVRTQRFITAAPLLTHLFALALAVGLPSGVGTRAADAAAEAAAGIRRRMGRYASRAERLHALRQVLVLESALLGVYPLLVAAATHGLPRWGVSSVIAVASTTIVWPLERIARAQRAESGRLAALSGGVDR